jgi:hypothetical protein
MAGDPCPECGRTNTAVDGFGNPTTRYDGIGEMAVVAAGPRYTMRCLNPRCLHGEVKSGIPGM